MLFGLLAVDLLAGLVVKHNIFFPTGLVLTGTTLGVVISLGYAAIYKAKAVFNSVICIVILSC